MFGSDRRPIPPNAKGGAFVEDAAGDWYVCFNVEVKDLAKGNGSVGIDLGLKLFVVTSDNQCFEAPRYYRKYETKLATAQRAHNYDRVRAINIRIANCRKDFLHKLSKHLTDKYAVIIVGDVSPTRLVKTNMAKSVTDASWGMFRRQLEYKASRHRAVYLKIDEGFTTQRCSHCQAIPDSSPKGKSDLGIREWKCSECGANHDRDVNAAKNILAIGLSTQPLVEGSPTALMSEEVRVYEVCP